MSLSAADHEGKASGQATINAKQVTVSSINVDPKTKKFKEVAQGGSIEVYAEKETMVAKKDLAAHGEETAQFTSTKKLLVNGKETTEYTFKMDYYWMMGDNRHNSADSRYWGFVPEDHIVGKPIFIWWSSDPDRHGFSGIRWSRLFRFVDNIK